MKNGFKNVNVILEDKVIKGSLSFEGDRILSFEDPENVILEGENIYVCPGFIDEHIHGANGSDVMDASKSSLSIEKMCHTRKAFSNSFLKESTFTVTMANRWGDVVL